MPAPMKDNLAYDLSLFEEKKARPKEEPKPEEPKLVARKSNTRVAVKILAVVLLIGSVVGLMLYSQAQLTALNATSQNLSKQLEKAQDEQARLRIELDRKVSTAKIEEYVQANGLVKQEKNQVHYVNLSEGDVLEVQDAPSTGWIENIKSFFQSIKEYFA